MADEAVFDPRPLRVAVTIAIFFLVVPGSGEGAALLWTFGQGVPPVPLIAPSTHAMLQLAGGFMTLIWSFLALGVPHLLDLDMRRARRIVAPILVVAAGLAATFFAERAGHAPAVIAARSLGVVGALLGLAVLVAARVPRRPWRRLVVEAPLPGLVLALTLYPVGWGLYALEPSGMVRAGTGAEIVLFCVVVPVVMAMGWKMFSAMLQIEAGHAPSFFVGLGSWLCGGALIVVARVWPATHTAALALAAPLLLLGAAAWLRSLRYLRRRSGGLVLVATAGPELRLHAIVAVVMLVGSPFVFLAAALTSRPGLLDVARHLVGVGFVLVVTMGVTLRALPRFCRGRPSSPGVGIATLALLVLGVVLRAGRGFPDVAGSAVLVRTSAVVTLAAVVVWGLHLLRGLWRPAR